ncbi:MAG: Gfo/Idh/MocA family protein [Paracoccaceae bacterium]
MSASAQPFSLVVVGFGWWGRHVAARLQAHPAMRLAGVVEPDTGQRSAILAAGAEHFENIAEALSRAQTDAVVLTTPNLLHEEQVVQCAKAGKHVFCEKPLGLTAASARRSVAACQAAGVQLGIGHERRFEPAMLALKAAIARGDLGTIMHTETAFSHDRMIATPKGDWRTSKAACPAAGMTATGIHLTDLLISLFGRVEALQAMTSDRSLGWESGDVTTAQLRFEAGMTASLSAVIHTPHFIRMHVFGSEKWVQILNDAHPDDPEGVVRQLTAQTGRPVIQKDYAWTDTVNANLEAFMRAARGEAPYPFSPEEIVHNIEVLEAISIAAEEHRTVRIDEV